MVARGQSGRSRARRCAAGVGLGGVLKENRTPSPPQKAKNTKDPSPPKENGGGVFVVSIENHAKVESGERGAFLPL